MRPYIFYFTVSLLFFAACKKVRNIDTFELPWQFTLTDSTLNKSYNYGAATIGTAGFNDYPSFEGLGAADSSHFETSSYFYVRAGNPASLKLSISLISLDTSLARSLIKSNSLLTKQTALKNIFSIGKIYKLLSSSSVAPGLFCNFTDEKGVDNANNIANPACKGNIAIINSQVWDDGSGTAKIKVGLTYNFTLQGRGSSTWFPELKSISGTMNTFFAVP